MKPVAAIIEPAQIDVEELTRQIDHHLAAERMADRQIAEHERLAAEHSQAATQAREVRRQARLELGALLNRVRGAWPTRGPKAKGWGEYLERRGLADSTARAYMDEARDPVGFAERRAKSSAPAEPPEPDDHGQYGPRVDPPADPGRATAAPFHQLTATELVRALAALPAEERKRVLRETKASAAEDDGVDRDAWCTPKWIADAIGEVDLDPCSNDRSHIRARSTFRLDFQEDGLERAAKVAADQRVFVNPPYSKVTPWIEGYLHTRFVFLLKLDPSTRWFQALIARTELVLIPRGTRVAFEPPPGVPPDKANANPFPHALFYARAEDATPEIRALCFAWRVDTNEQAAAPMSDAAATTH